MSPLDFLRQLLPGGAAVASAPANAGRGAVPEAATSDAGSAQEQEQEQQQQPGQMRCPRDVVHGGPAASGGGGGGGGGCPFLSSSTSWAGAGTDDRDVKAAPTPPPPPLFGRKKVQMLYEHYISLPALRAVWERPMTEKPELEPQFAAAAHGMELCYLLLAHFLTDARAYVAKRARIELVSEDFTR